MDDGALAHGFGTSMHWPSCRNGRCTGCMEPLAERFRLAELDRDRPLCDSTVPSFFDDERRFDCGHQATLEALWVDGKWHPRCHRHVNGYPADRVRPLQAAQ